MNLISSIHDSSVDPISLQTEYRSGIERSHESENQSKPDVNLELYEDLTHDEARDRHLLERQVERAFYLAGSSLAELKDRRLYRSTHSSFEKYCQDRFGMKRRHPYRLIDAAKVVDNILKVCPIGTQNNRDANLPTQILPTSERQVRPLTKLSANEQRQVWARAIEVAGNKAPSGTIVSQIVSEQRTLASRIMCPNAEHCYKAGQKITIKFNHPSLANCSGIIKQIPNRAEVIVDLTDGRSESIKNEYIELELDSSINELPPEGIAYTQGVGIEYNVRLSQDTWDKLNAYAAHEGAASLDGAISRLLDSVSKK